MNLSPVTVSSAPSTIEASRGEPVAQEGFSSILSQQRGHVREDGTAAPRTGVRSNVDEHDVGAPDETLALLAASITLPLMARGVVPAGEPGAAIRAAHPGGAARSAMHTASLARDVSKGLVSDMAEAVLSPRSGPGEAADVRGTSLTGVARQPLSALDPFRQPVTEAEAQGDAQAATARPHTVLSSGADSARSATRPGAPMDATQVVMAHIASDTGLDAVAMRTTAISDSANRSMLDTGNTMFGPASSPVAGVSPPMQSNSPIVATPLSSPAWSADFSQQFISMTRGRDLSTPHTIELRLDPPSLGPVRITLQISDSIAQAAFVSPHAAVRQAIENALPSLQQQLADAGLSLGQASVNDQSASQQGFEQSSSHGGPDKTAVFSLDGHAAESPGTLPPPARQTPRSPDALVDTFA